MKKIKFLFCIFVFFSSHKRRRMSPCQVRATRVEKICRPNPAGFISASSQKQPVTTMKTCNHLKAGNGRKKNKTNQKQKYNLNCGMQSVIAFRLPLLLCQINTSLPIKMKSFNIKIKKSKKIGKF